MIKFSITFGDMKNVILVFVCIISFCNIGFCQKENFHEGYEDEIYTDEFTDGVKSMPTGSLLEYFPKNGWKEVSTPKSGDIVVWKGHTALVEAYDAAKKKGVSVIHATKYGSVESVVQEDYKLSYYEGKGAKFYRPINDKPDGWDISWAVGTIFEQLLNPFELDLSGSSAVQPTVLGPVGMTSTTAPAAAAQTRNVTPMQKVTPKGPPTSLGSGSRSVTFKHKPGAKFQAPLKKPIFKLGKG